MTRATAFASSSDGNDRLPGIATRDDSQLFTTVEINVYGQKQHSDSIGKVFADSKLYLQKPCFRNDDAPYENPQLLNLPEFLDENRILSSEVVGGSTGDDAMLTDLSSVLDHLYEQVSSVEVEIDSRVVTQLERYGALKCPRVALNIVATRSEG